MTVDKTVPFNPVNTKQDEAVKKAFEAVKRVPIARRIVRKLYKDFKTVQMHKAIPSRQLQDIGSNITSLTEQILLHLDESRAEAAIEFIEQQIEVATWPNGVPASDEDKRWTRFLLLSWLNSQAYDVAVAA